MDEADFRWSLAQSSEEPDSSAEDLLWVGPPQWPLPAGFRYKEGWRPPASWPIVEGWEFWRRATGARNDVNPVVAESAAKLFDRYGSQMIPREPKVDRDIAEMAGQVLLSDPAFPRTHRSLLALRYYRDSAANFLYALVWRREQRFLCLCCYQDLYQARLDISVGAHLDDLESHLSIGFPSEGLPDRVATSATRADTHNWLRVAAELESAKVDYLQTHTDGSTYDADAIVTSKRKEARLRQWLTALTTGELPNPIEVKALEREQKDWQEAEELAAVAIRNMGWKDAVVTPVGADAGIDVRGRHVAAQVKYLSTPVGRPVLQRLIGAGRGRELACFSKSGFSRQASDFAAEEGIVLFLIELPGRVVAVNDPALEWLERWED